MYGFPRLSRSLRSGRESPDPGDRAPAASSQASGKDDEALLWTKAAEKSKAAAKELAAIEKAEREGTAK